MTLYGLLGHPLTHSFSKNFFTNKFAAEGIQAAYLNFDIADIEQFPSIVSQHPELKGLNVTIPYKQAVIPYLDELDETAKAIGAVNVIRIERDGDKVFLKGYNSDVVGFANSISPMLNQKHRRALVLGNGGASKAVIYALNNMGIETRLVSRTASEGALSYEDLTVENINDYQVIVNCTPLGMYPHVDEQPALPYEGITEGYVLYDLIYNPEETRFLAEGVKRGAAVKNGHEMLILQALESWKIWNSKR